MARQLDFEIFVNNMINFNVFINWYSFDDLLPYYNTSILYHDVKAFGHPSSGCKVTKNFFQFLNL